MCSSDLRRLQQLLAPLQARGLISVDWVPGQSWGGVTAEQFGFRLARILASAPTNVFSPGKSAGSVQEVALLSNKTTAILSDCGDASFVLASCQAETKSWTASRNASIFASGSPPRVELAMLPDLSRTRNASTPGLSLKHRTCSLGAMLQR